MQFVITSDLTFDWPVEMNVPDPKRAGAKVSQKFTGQFRYLPRTEALAMQEEYVALGTQLERDHHEHELIRRVLIGWGEDVVDGDNQPVPFSAGALEQALEFHWFRQGVYAAYQKAITSGGARRGN